MNNSHDSQRSQWRHPSSPPGTLSKDHYQHAKSYSLAGGVDGNNYSHAIHHNGVWILYIYIFLPVESSVSNLSILSFQTLSPGKYSDVENNNKNDMPSPTMSPGRGSQYYYNMSPHTRQQDPPYSVRYWYAEIKQPARVISEINWDLPFLVIMDLVTIVKSADST